MLPQISGNATKMGNYSSTMEKQKTITIAPPENLLLRNANHQSSAEVLPEHKSVLDFGTPSRHPTKLENHKFTNSAIQDR